MTEQLTETARSLGLRGAPNARDLGGYPAGDGRTVRQGVAYRADALNRPTEDDRVVLAGLGLRAVVDLRSLAEVREAAPDRMPGLPVVSIPDDLPSGTVLTAESDLVLHHLPVFATEFDIYVALRNALANKDAAKQHAVLGDGRAERMMTGLYRWFVTDAVARERFATLIRLLAVPDGPPLLFHCTAGKDRTGWAAAVVLTALGVDRDTVFADYLLTNTRSAALVEHVVDSFGTRGLMKDPTLLLPIFRAEPGYLEASFAEVATGWPTFDHFWRDGLGLDDQTLAALHANLLA